MNTHKIYQTPDSWIECIAHIPLLADVVCWEMLREWGLSEVWRVALPSGETWIAKRACGSMTKEVTIYRELLIPLGVNCPRLFAVWETETTSFFVMEDIGSLTLEAQPDAANFVAAAHELARLRCTTAHRLLEEPMTVPAHYVFSTDDFLRHLEYVLAHPWLTMEQKHSLQTIAHWLPAQLDNLYTQLPPALCHNDYHVKNLVFRAGSAGSVSSPGILSTDQEDAAVVPVDWAMAFISPYHGDLYCLLRNAGARKVARALVLAAYEDELRHLAPDDPCALRLLASPLSWQHALGGVCFLILGLEWILREAHSELPESILWIPKMLASMELCAQKIH